MVLVVSCSGCTVERDLAGDLFSLARRVIRLMATVLLGRGLLYFEQLLLGRILNMS